MCWVDVESGDALRGKTVVREGGNVLVASDVRANEFVRRFCDALGLPYVEDPEGFDRPE
jgi:hypothetical protein